MHTAYDANFSKKAIQMCLQLLTSWALRKWSRTKGNIDLWDYLAAALAAAALRSPALAAAALLTVLGQVEAALHCLTWLEQVLGADPPALASLQPKAILPKLVW